MLITYIPIPIKHFFFGPSFGLVSKRIYRIKAYSKSQVCQKIQCENRKKSTSVKF